MMTRSLRNILCNFEDPARSLLGPNVKWLEMWGLLLPKNKLKKTFYMTLQILMFIFIFTEYIEICLSIIGSDLNTLLENIKYSMVSTVNLSKVVSFLVWQEDWKSIMKYVCEENFQRRKSRDRKSQDIIRKYTKYCRTITYFYWFLAYSTIMIIILQSAVKYVIISKNGKNTYDKYDVQVVSTWLPINQYTPLGYFIKISYQLFALLFSGGWITSFDANAITIIVFFKGELELLRTDAKYLFGNEENPRTKREAKIKLRECQKRHTDLIKYSRIFDSCLSPIMLLYVIVCSGVLCATAYQITMETSALQKFIKAEYLIFAVSQLFMYCWHSNELLFVSRDLSLGPYESIWWNRDISEQIDINILTEQFNKAIVFSAGPFTEITVATFISILKGAYSYYTLLNQSQEK